MASNTIWLKGDGLVKEAVAGGAITPGHLVTRNSSNQFVVHPAAGERCPPMFAMEGDFVGNDITKAYAPGDRVQAIFAQPGAEIYALLPANAAAVVIGDLLESNGDGTLRRQSPEADLTMGTNITAATANGSLEDSAATNPTEANFNNNMKEIAVKLNAIMPAAQRGVVIARALEAVDNSGSGSVARIKVEVV